MILETAWEDDIREGDELAAYDKDGNMVGSIAFNKVIMLLLYGVMMIAEEKEGLAIGEVFSLFYTEE